ncbi:MAG: RHS repeat protein [Bacillaceae bacterium]|nr:RHS repeat protein [Bacillaceae bacterium]
MVNWKKIAISITFLLLIIPFQAVNAETLEDQLNNLVGPKQQYSTYLSPAYLKTHTTEETISPQSGELKLVQTDYVLPGRNGLDLEIKRIYKSGISNVKEMKVKYVNGAWVDYVHADASTSSFYEDRYNIGIGMRFSFPMMEIKENSDGTSHRFLHTETGDVYRLKPYTVNGVLTYFVEGQTIKDVKVMESSDFSNGQSDGTSKYVMIRKNGKKAYFAEDGRILGIVDRYGNKITFEYTTLSYSIDGKQIKKRLISRITDTVGRVVRIEYKEDHIFTVGPIQDQNYSSEETYKASQNPNKTHSGDLQGKFQVIIHLPGDKKIVYDKSAVLVSDSGKVIRTRLQRVYDTDGKPKYHFWYEQTDLGFTFMNGTKYSVYNRYENLVQIDYCKTNQINRYVYSTFTKSLNKGSMQYRKIFARQDLVKKGYDPSQEKFLDRFVTEVKDQTHYSYTNEPDGFGFDGYKKYDDYYLKNTYRYYTEQKDFKGNTTRYTYDGIHELIKTVKQGNDHKIVITTERDEMKFPKKKERLIYHVENGNAVGEPVHKIENFRYDEYGNLTNYTGPLAQRDENGYPVNDEHTVTYSYAYDKYHVLTTKTWKQDADTTSQIINSVDQQGNIVKQTKINTDDQNNWIISEFAYDQYGNLIREKVSSGGQSFVTHYQYGVDVNGVDQKGAYLTKKYRYLDGVEVANRYGYDFKTGNLITEVDPKGNRTTYKYDVLNRVKQVIQPDNSTKNYEYLEDPYQNFQVKYTDPEQHAFLYEYDIMGNLVQASVWENDQWNVLKTIEYDEKGNKIKEIDANGHSIRYEYDSRYRLVKKTRYENDTVNKGSITLDYTVNASGTPLLVTLTDEEGFVKKLHYDIMSRLVKEEATPDNQQFFTVTHTYDYVGNKLSTTDARGHTTHYAYDNLGRLIKKVDALGHETSYAYTALNGLWLVREPGDKVTENTFDALGRFIQKKVYKMGSDDYVYTRYEYDLAGNVTRLKKGTVKNGTDTPAMDVSYAYDEMNRKTDEYTQIDDTRKAHTAYRYDLNGNLTQEIQYANAAETQYRLYTYDHDYGGRVIEEKGSYKELDSQGNVTVYGQYHKKFAYDLAGNLIQEQEWNGTEFDTTTYKYNYLNKLTEKIEPYQNGEYKKTVYQYDKVGNVVSQALFVLGLMTTTAYVYDGLGRKVKMIDPLGNTTRYVYDQNGNLTKVIDPRYQSVSLESAPGIEYEYDPLNRLVKKVAFDGSNREVIEYREYDARGNVTLIADGEGYNPEQPSASIGKGYQYDVLDRRVVYISAQSLAEYGGRETRRVTYDAVGNILSETGPYGEVTRYSYYLNGQLKEKVYPDGSRERFDYDLTGKGMKEKTDRRGYITRTFYNIFEKPYRIEYPDGTYETYAYSPKGENVKKRDRAGHITTFEYNAAGNRISEKRFIRSDADYTNYRLIKTAYDEANRLIQRETFLYKEPRTSGLNPQTISVGDRTTYVYDKAGRQIKVIGPNGRQTVYEYDRAGNLITEKKKVKEGYDDVKRYAYDFRSRLTSESVLVHLSALENSELSGARFDQVYADHVLATTHYEYYANDLLKSKQDPEGNITHYEYDYDGRLTKKTDPLQAATLYKYDLNGNLVEQKNARGVSTYYEYDDMNRVIRKKEPAAGGGFAITRYLYDEAGNLVKKVAPNDYDPAKDQPSLASTMPGIRFEYDEMNRRTVTYDPENNAIEYIQYDQLDRVRKVVDGLRYNGDMATSPGTVYHYDGLGRMIQKTDAIGHRTLYAYDVLGNLVSKTDPRNHTTRYEYAPDSTLVKITYPDGGIVTYTYDLVGRKTSETDQRGNKTTYAYNAFGKITEITDPYQYTEIYKYDLNGNRVYYEDKRGSVTRFKYDANNRLVEKKVPLYVDDSQNVVYRVESYTYDVLGNVTRKTFTTTKGSFKRETRYTYYDNNLVHTVSDNSGAYLRYEYDKNGNRTKMEQLRDSGVFDIERYEYDQQDRMIKRIRLVEEEHIKGSDGFTNLENLRDPDYPGRIRIITGYEYDVLGNKIKEIDPRAYQYAPDDTTNRAKHTVSFAYDVLNRLEKVIHLHNGQEVYREFGYDEAGNKIRVKNERGFVTNYTYDSVNRLKSVTDAGGNTMTYTYDAAGNKIAVTNAKGYKMTYQYDKMNRLFMIKDAYDVVIQKNIHDPNGNIVKKFDALGYLSGTTDDTRYGTEYVYDLANRLVRVIDPEVAEDGTAAFTFEYEYNAAGEKIRETNALGETTIYEYDPAGRLIRVTDSLGVETTFAYDNAGNKVYMVDGRGKITRYRYGAFGLLTEVINAKGMSMKYRYDLALNVAEKTDRKGYHTTYTYDNQNRLFSKTVLETGDKVTYAYDATGNRIKMADESGTSLYSYDKRNLLEQITKNGVVEIRYTYDSLGNIKTVTDKLGFTVSYTYDKSSRMETVSYNGQTTTYQYDKNGNRKATIYPGGVRVDYTYDKNNRLLSLVNKKPDGSIVSEYHYTYDGAGRTTSKTDSFGTTTYAYDPAGRVLKVEAPGKTTVYTYDDAGNRETMMETYTSPQLSGYVDPVSQEAVSYMVKKSEYFYSDINELIKRVETMYDDTGQEVMEKHIDYLYDENGNEISQKVSYIQPHDRDKHQFTGANPYESPEAYPIHTMIEKVNSTYNGFNRLKTMEKVKNGERVTVEYVYNGDGLRTKKIVKSSKEGYTPQVTHYHYDRQHVILETDATGTLKTRYIRGINYIARTSSDGGTVSYYLFNGHGDVVQTVSATGEVENQYDYDIFGNPILTVEVYKNSIRYAGEFYDEETGLYYLRARYYNPYIGRFITEDSYWGEDTNPLSLNRYTYAHNNPIMYVDPSGHFVNLSLVGVVVSVVNAITDGVNKSDEDDSDSSSTNNNRKSSSKEDKVDDIIKKIDEAKKVWLEEERTAGKDKKAWTLRQIYSHLRAEYYRSRLSVLENDNKYAQDVYKGHGMNAGLWEEYKADRQLRKIEEKQANGEAISSKEIFDYTKYKAMAKVARDKGRNVFDRYDKQDILNQLTKDSSFYDLDVEKLKIVDIENNLTYDEANKFSYDTAIMQIRLNQLGYRVKVDGKFGQNTLFNVNLFKDFNNLWNFDEYKGVVGNTTWDLLFSEKAERYSQDKFWEWSSQHLQPEPDILNEDNQNLYYPYTEEQLKEMFTEEQLEHLFVEWGGDYNLEDYRVPKEEMEKYLINLEEMNLSEHHIQLAHSISDNFYVRVGTYLALIRLAEDYYEQTGQNIVVTSTYRPGDPFWHGTGFAVDIDTPNASRDSNGIVRFPEGSKEKENLRILIEAAIEAGFGKVIHGDVDVIKEFEENEKYEEIRFVQMDDHYNHLHLAYPIE